MESQSDANSIFNFSLSMFFEAILFIALPINSSSVSVAVSSVTETGSCLSAICSAGDLVFIECLLSMLSMCLPIVYENIHPL